MSTIAVSQSRVAESETPVGRDAELVAVRVFLARAATGGDVLLVRGEPGVGKTLLLDAAADMASAADVRVLRAAGVEFEAELSFSGLNQALLPLVGEFAQLAGAHRDALNVALGFGEGAAPDRLVLSNATLSLLRQAATARPLLVILDDLPWLDRASAGVLGFVARRLTGSRVGLLGASRTGEESFFDRSGLRELELRQLDDEAANRLIRARFPELAPNIRKRILIEAHGNPLALLELPTAVSTRRRSGLQALSPVLPLSRRLQALFASRIQQLPARTRQLLLLMALDGTGDVRVLQTAGAPTFGDLAAAERARLAYVDEGTHRPAFRHPLIRSTVVELSTGDERRLANRMLAELWADQPDRCAWHLAEATIEPDEHVAALLEQAAYRVLPRGDAVRSVAALVRASELSPLAPDRNRRLAAAAYIGANAAGELRNAAELLAQVRVTDPELKESLHTAVAASALIFYADGDIDTSHRLLVGAIQSRLESDDTSDNALEEALHTLMLVCFFGGRAELWKPFDGILGRLTTRVPAAVFLASKTLADPVRTGAAVLEQLDSAIEGLVDGTDPARIVRVCYAATFVDRMAGGREALLRVASDGREGGPIASGINALVQLAWDGFWAGQWDQAQKVVDEGLELCEAHGYGLPSWALRYVKALLAAGRGDYAATRVLVDEMIQWSVPRGARTVQLNAWHVQTLAAMGRGDFEEGYRHATTISPAGTFASHVPFALCVPMDLVEAAVRTGRHAEAAAHVGAMREANIAAMSPRLALIAAGSAAIAAQDDAAVGLFEEALAIPGTDRWPFDLARVQLAFGERLRRLRAMTASRAHLIVAIETFDRLGARPWAERAGNELRATGQTKPRAGDYATATLTAQEWEIARLAAEGLTNKQIAERLFLSHRTVGGHLHRLFPKLGIATRAALRDALASLPPQQGDAGRN
jgi:DNA-binding CsgD family transcriptional regulator